MIGHRNPLTERVRTYTTSELCMIYAALSGDHRDGIPEVRGATMTELERRNPLAFERWIDCDVVDQMERPSLFFCN